MSKYVKLTSHNVNELMGHCVNIWALLIMAIWIIEAIKTVEKRAKMDKRQGWHRQTCQSKSNWRRAMQRSSWFVARAYGHYQLWPSALFWPLKPMKNERRRIKDGFERDKEDVSRPLGIAQSKSNDCASFGYMACMAIVHGGCSVWCATYRWETFVN